MKAAIVGIAGPDLLPEEAALFRALRPAGVILFGRNVQDPAQLSAPHRGPARGASAGRRSLWSTRRAAASPACVRRIGKRTQPPRSSAALPDAERAAWLTGALIGAQCGAAGFTIVAAPVLDTRFPGTHDVVGDRAFAADPASVARIGRAVAEGLMAAGIMPVGKHCPGHGRVLVDSHLALPRVTTNDLDADIQPFALNADLPWMMTAHIVYDAFDPDLPATLSPRVIDTVIRGRIGFKGVLVTDDLAMNALSGAPADRAVAALAAGCDIALYCTRRLRADRGVAARRAHPLTPAAHAAAWTAARALLAPKRQMLDVGRPDRGTSRPAGMNHSFLLDLALAVIPVVLAITLHEAAHGYAALALGDTTARDAGRLSLNPIRHIDRVGTILLPGFLLITQLLLPPHRIVLHVRLGQAGAGVGLQVPQSAPRHGDRGHRRAGDELLPRLAGRAGASRGRAR